MPGNPEACTNRDLLGCPALCRARPREGRTVPPACRLLAALLLGDGSSLGCGRQEEKLTNATTSRDVRMYRVQCMRGRGLVRINTAKRACDNDDYVLETLMRNLIGHDRSPRRFLFIRGSSGKSSQRRDPSGPDLMYVCRHAARTFGSQVCEFLPKFLFKETWVQLGSNKASGMLLTVPKLAVGAVFLN